MIKNKQLVAFAVVCFSYSCVRFLFKLAAVRMMCGGKSERERQRERLVLCTPVRCLHVHVKLFFCRYRYKCAHTIACYFDVFTHTLVETSTRRQAPEETQLFFYMFYIQTERASHPFFRAIA